MPPPANSTDQRKAKREACRKEARIAVTGPTGPEAFVVTTRNVSSSGIAFSSTRPFSAGTVFVLSMPRAGQAPLQITGAVVYCKWIGRGSFSIGARMTRKLSKPEDGACAA
jgi:hypothetical protein